VVDTHLRAAREPRSRFYDGAVYGRMIDPLLAGVHGFVVSHLPEGARVLDACCGTGALTVKLAQAGRDAVGIDLSPANIAYAERCGTEAALPNLRFAVRDVGRLDDYMDAAFDVATIVLALHEMPTDARAPVLRELARVAGKVVIVDYRVPMPWNFAGVRNRVIEITAGREHFGAFRDFTRRGGLGTLVGECDLEVVSERTLDKGTLDVITVTTRR
jgi:SAM-dependent methyltransferase